MVRLKKVGLIGEDPSDTSAVINLLSKKYALNFISLLDNQRGDNLETAKTQRILKIEIQTKKPDLLIFIRDLDAPETDGKQKSKRYNWFNKLKAGFKGESYFLLNVYEIEALVLSDIAAFNKLFKTSISFKGNPMTVENPKGFLKEKPSKQQRRFEESDNPEIFQELNFNEVSRKCRYFRDFITELDKALL